MPSTPVTPPEEVAERRTTEPSQSSPQPVKINPEISELFQTQVKSPVKTVSAVKEELPSLHIWDFAGHELYYTTHQVTVTPSYSNNKVFDSEFSRQLINSRIKYNNPSPNKNNISIYYVVYPKYPNVSQQMKKK